MNSNIIQPCMAAIAFCCPRLCPVQVQSGKQGTVATWDAGHLGSVQELPRSG